MDQTKLHAMDASAVGIMGATLLGWLPSIAALLTIVWTAIRIYETKTFQAILKAIRHKLGSK